MVTCKKLILKIANSFLGLWDLSITKRTVPPIPKKVRCQLNEYLHIAKRDSQFDVVKNFTQKSTIHKETSEDFQFAFCADNIARLKPKSILDVGSYRHFLLGLLASYKVTTIDFRSRKIRAENETPFRIDAKSLPFEDDVFDVVLSISVIEHLGLTCYGDVFDLDADRLAINEMVRVLKPGGHLILTVPITEMKPFIVFNARRVYSYNMIKIFVKELQYVSEKIYSSIERSDISLSKLRTTIRKNGIYCGCYKKVQILNGGYNT